MLNNKIDYKIIGNNKNEADIIKKLEFDNDIKKLKINKEEITNANK